MGIDLVSALIAFMSVGLWMIVSRQHWLRGTANVFFAFGFAWVLLFMRGHADTRLRNMMLCFIPFFLGMMVVGNLSEIRIFTEFIPLMALLLAGKLASDVKPAG